VVASTSHVIQIVMTMRVVFVLVTSGGDNYSNLQLGEINIPVWDGQ